MNFSSNSDENLEQKHSFWNASDNVKCGGYHDSIFDDAHNKKYIKYKKGKDVIY